MLKQTNISDILASQKQRQSQMYRFKKMSVHDTLMFSYIPNGWVLDGFRF